ncbi:hypothetical protein [Actinokineospora pegani]|uniref:hypothetical protein n=1 Tax=Actinokineospora pegani TaxID=2654637 RepID=UPI0012EAE3C3|nr:hypothetical protein [Actinokineospora pegani]
MPSLLQDLASDVRSELPHPHPSCRVDLVPGDSATHLDLWRGTDKVATASFHHDADAARVELVCLRVLIPWQGKGFGVELLSRMIERYPDCRFAAGPNGVQIDEAIDWLIQRKRHGAGRVGRSRVARTGSSTSIVE